MQFTKRDINKQNRNGEVSFYKGGDSSSQSSSGGLTLDQVRRNFVSIDFFKRLFQAHDSTDSSNILNIDPNDTDSTITDIQFKFGAWSDSFISALGRNSSGGGGGTVVYLNDLDDVDTTGASDGKVLTYQNGMWVPGTGGGGGSVAWADITNKPTTLSGYGITDAIPLAGSDRITGKLEPNTNNSIDLGSSDYRWRNVYGVNGSFSSSLTVGGTNVSLAGHTHSASDITSGTFAAARIPTGISITGNAATATKATQDGAGNVITSKYVTLDTEQVINARKYIYSSETDTPLQVKGNTNNDTWIAFRLSNDTIVGYFGVDSSKQPRFYDTSSHVILHHGNYSSILDSSYVNVTGDTMTGDLILSKNDGTIAVDSGSRRVGLSASNNGGVWDWTYGAWLIADNGTNTFLNIGNVGIGTTSPSSKLTVAGTITPSDTKTYDVGTSSLCWRYIYGLWVGSPGGEVFDIGANNQYHIRINTNGNVGIGTTSPSQRLHVDGNILATGAVTALSDMRRKSPVSEVNTRIEDIAKLPIFYYKWKMGYDDDMHIGTSAQEVQKLFPELVFGKDELSVDYSVLGTTIGILNSRALVTLEQRVTALESKLEERS